MGLSAGPQGALRRIRPSTVANDTGEWDATDNMLAYLIQRADKLAAFADNPTAEAELQRLVNLIEAYEIRRWPSGMAAGGKG